MSPTANKVLILGADSYIGAGLCPFLENTAYAITAQPGPSRGGINVLDAAQVETLIKRVEPSHIVYLPAAPDAPYSSEQVSRCFDVQVKGLVNVCEVAARTEVQRLVHFGTAKIYSENSDRPFRETDPAEPKSVYAETKKLAEEVLAFFHRTHGLDYISLRMTTVYGPGPARPNQLIDYLLSQISRNAPLNLTPGEQRRDFLYIEDVFRAVEKALRSTAVGCFNIASGKGTSIRELANLIKEITESRSELQFGALPYRKDEMMSMVSDISKADKELDWRPTVPLTEGIRRLIEHHFTGKTQA